jgi:hypothetical protein
MSVDESTGCFLDMMMMAHATPLTTKLAPREQRTLAPRDVFAELLRELQHTHDAPPISLIGPNARSSTSLLVS